MRQAQQSINTGHLYNSITESSGKERKNGERSLRFIIINQRKKRKKNPLNNRRLNYSSSSERGVAPFLFPVESFSCRAVNNQLRLYSKISYLCLCPRTQPFSPRLLWDTLLRCVALSWSALLGTRSSLSILHFNVTVHFLLVITTAFLFVVIAIVIAPLPPRSP